MENKLYKVNEVNEFINQGKILTLAGDERVLSKLEKGKWIGGTIPYFMGDKEGLFSQELIFVNEISENAVNFSITSYSKSEINKIVDDSYSNGFSIVIVPPFTEVHKEFALKIPDNQNLFNNPITGWVSGTDLSSNDIAKTYNGLTGENYTDKIVALHAELPANKIARIDIVNIFRQSKENVVIEFLEDGFSCKNCLINGTETNFAQYIEEHNIDNKLPLISDYSGALINVSIQYITGDTVNLYAPVFKGRKYKFAEPIPDYVKSFNSLVKGMDLQPKFSCNCILNYLYGELEGKKINNITGPITFGEIGYQLLNQTLVLLHID